MPSYVVTGASRGLGYAWVKYLSAISGNTVFGIVRNKAATEARLEKDGITNVHILVSDVTDVAGLQAAAEAVAKVTGGGLDYLIHNTGYVSEETNDRRTIADYSPEVLEKDLLDHFRANAIGTAHTINAFLPLVRQGSVKKIIVTSTGLADLDLTNDFTITNGASYSASKAAANVIVAKFNAAVGEKDGILVFSMSPGLVDTSEGKQPTEEQLEGFKVMAGKFANYAPDFKGPITAEESVKMQLEVIEKATVETYGGKFVSHHGDKFWL